MLAEKGRGLAEDIFARRIAPHPVEHPGALVPLAGAQDR
jgi:hypothetical protein